MQLVDMSILNNVAFVEAGRRQKSVATETDSFDSCLFLHQHCGRVTSDFIAQ